MKLLIFIQLLTIIYVSANGKKKTPEQKVPLPNSPKRDNPNFIRDRFRNIIMKPEMPPSWTSRHQQLYDSNWMDYCDPYHCDDYHKTVCGLNRRKMRFKWFQSTCHLILNNQCSYFRGLLKYDMIETKYCNAYVMFLRAGCPHQSDCDKYKISPLCAISTTTGHAVLFQNKCYLDAINCKNATLQDYEVVRMSLCESLLAVEPSREAAKSDEETFIYKIIRDY
ncbi:hypothetical protein PYW08_012213 [Mythimna loreyi]|uniref:Uncharacterized protein n=1 Tax=Mythimna loreyi TaxID=667449 RepID=A0ACC2PZP2_9NEOP|nr:hypothetical protein PYW08_012213 [Mythimna loreyi]